MNSIRSNKRGRDFEYDDDHHTTKRSRGYSIDSARNDRLGDDIDSKVANALRDIVQGMTFPDKYDDRIYISGNAEIRFTADINDDTIERFKKVISDVLTSNKKHLVNRRSEEDNDPFSIKDDDSDVGDKKFVITYVVNSPGGSVSSVMGFVDYLGMIKKQYSNVEFVSIATGLVASAGTIMCIAADKRKMTQNAFAMIHELSTSLGYTTYTRIQTHAEFTKKLHDAGVKLYLKQIGKEYNEENVHDLETKLLRETWLSAEEYKEMGFVDEIL